MPRRLDLTARRAPRSSDPLSSAHRRKPFRDYNDRIVSGYLKDLDETNLTTARKKRVLANALHGISHHLGIDVFFTDSASPEDEQKILPELAVLLHPGIGS